MDKSEMPADDIQIMLSTVRHVPDKRDNNASDRISGPRGKETPEKKDMSGKIMLIAGITILVAGLGFLLVFLIGRALEHDPLNGIWSMDDVTVYVFNGKGHGKLSLPLNTYEFDYVLEENSILIDFYDPDAIDRSYLYSVSDDELTLIADDGSSFRFTRADSRDNFLDSDQT